MRMIWRGEMGWFMAASVGGFFCLHYTTFFKGCQEKDGTKFAGWRGGVLGDFSAGLAFFPEL
jgi:hypothetical protein